MRIGHGISLGGVRRPATVVLSGTTLDPLNKHSTITLSNGDLTAATSAAATYGSVRSVAGYTTGKKYYEVVLGANDGGLGYVFAGYCNAAAPLNTYVGSTAMGVNGRGFAPWRSSPLTYYNAGSASIVGNVMFTYPGDILGVALDIDTMTCTLYKNGVATGDSFTTPSGATTWHAAVSLYNTRSITCRFAPASWSWAGPSGFGPW